MRYNFKDVTFLIPTRLDSIDRLVNLQATVSFIQKYFETKIRILEADSFNSFWVEKLISKNVDYTFVEDFDPVFFRTFYINKMVEMCDTSYVCVWDTDIIVPPEQLIKSVELLRTDKADFASPYQKKALDTSKIIRDLYLKKNDWEILDKHQNKMKQMYPPNPVGGAFFADRQKYVESGLENLNFYGWGIEDGERVTRWKVLGYRFERIEGNLYHLTHARGINSTFQSPEQRKKKLKLLENIRISTKDELRKEIENWKS